MSSVPRKLPRARKAGEIDFYMLFIIIMLLFMGLIMLFSASAPRALSSGNVYSITIRQSIYALMGVGGMILTANIDYKIYKRFANIIFISIAVLMFIVPIIGFASHGATRQISIGGVNLQPSEIAKFAVVFFFAARFSRQGKKELRSLKGFCINTALMLIMAAACVLQSHMSAAVVLVGVPMIMYIVAGMNMWHITLCGIIGGAGALALVISEPYRMDRFRALFDPFAYKLGIGWQIIQSMYAVGSGGLFGLGLGQSRQKYLYLPEAHNDYIFAIVCEELGFVGALAALALFCAFVWRGMRISMRAKDSFGSFLAFGITCVVALQVLINVGVVVSVLPSTGMQLPFFSSGGSSLVIMLTAMGVLLNISRGEKKGV